MARNKNTFEKHRREMEKKRKAEEKRKRRQTRKDHGGLPDITSQDSESDAESLDAESLDAESRGTELEDGETLARKDSGSDI